LRNLPTKELQNKYKCESLQYVTFGGVFSQRKDDKLESKSGFICLDLDEIEDPIALKKLIVENCSLLVLLFVSPRGNGLKAIFKCNPEFSYKDNYRAYSYYLSSNLNVSKNRIDESCASISKACFLCHDHDAYIHPFILNSGDNKAEMIDFLSSEFFKSEVEKNVGKNDEQVKEAQVGDFFQSPAFQYFPIKLNYEKRDCVESFMALCRICIRNHGAFEEGNRHNWILVLAALCNKFGMIKESAVAHFKAIFYNTPAIKNPNEPFDEKNDLLRSFDNIYEKNASDFRIWEKKDLAWETPVLPDNIFSELPDYFKKLVGQFPIQRERDIFFLGLIALLSSCFPRIMGLYDQRRCRSNVFLFVSAPAASGKGVLSFVRKIGEEIHQSFLDKYKDEMAEYEAIPDDEKKDRVKPELKKLFIPANNTSAKMIKTISINEVFGIINDTEADTITNANKGEHGHFTEMLRKAFHHEAIEYERKTNSEYITINDPSLSMLISGTPRQVNYLIKGLENGLASRFIFYNYVSTSVFKNVFEKGTDLDFIFRSASVELYNMCKPYFQDYLEDKKDELLFSFTEAQQENFHTFFSLKSEYLEHIYGTDIRGSINRLGLIFFRIAMVLSVIRLISSPENTDLIKSKFQCSDVDYKITTSIIEVLIHHTVSIFNQLKQSASTKKIENIKGLYFEKLPDDFNRKTSMEIAGLMQIKEKTAENYLTHFIKTGIMERVEHNHYKKALS